MHVSGSDSLFESELGDRYTVPIIYGKHFQSSQKCVYSLVSVKRNFPIVDFIYSTICTNVYNKSNNFKYFNLFSIRMCNVKS